MRKDDIFKEFLQHPLLQEKYKIDSAELPERVSDGLSSDHPIVRTIAMILEGKENKDDSDNIIRTKVINYLQTANTNL
ncbi:hypothetical protein LEM8419_02154 [Neolewinella maritima]|uniref:Uncharacterized protein n=1 Tax=Neolewinella maritima TaxID=1383882 RepID=A0ABM9B236_9BACT|nr:hypothetical protein LEM8419_02154 [Neolewinella maritima]